MYNIHEEYAERIENMKKLIFKKLLLILDAIELHSITLEETPIKVYEKLINDAYNIKLSEVKEIIQFLYHKQALVVGKNGIDLRPAPTIYAKSNQNSTVEALSLVETFLHDSSFYNFIRIQCKDNTYVSQEEICQQIDNEIFQMLTQTSIFDFHNQMICFQHKHLHRLRQIIQEYQADTQPLVSHTLTALYTSSIVSHEDKRIEYKNTKLSMIPYHNKDVILSIIPRRGIPHDRDETKSLQAFYKDTLFHEFDHACPICQINIAHMLIASHIKPFRDCAHLYEAIDHNNGLLLCRNHDYLFDQGYFTFDDNGYIILSQALLQKPNLETSYILHKNFKLSEQYMSKERRLFLSYHRTFIFLDSNK